MFTACHGMVSCYLTTAGWQVFQTRHLQYRTRQEVTATSHRDNQQDDYQVGGAKVLIESHGGVEKYQT